MTPQAIKFAPGSEVIVEGLGIPFGGPFNGRDIDGEYFSKNTDFCLEWFDPGQRPTLYHHGKDAALKTAVTGRVMEYDPTDVGIWTKAQLDSRNKYLGAIQQLVQDGALGFSSGAIPHLVQVDRKSGHIERWPWVELSLTPIPANPDAIAVYAVKSADALAHLEAIETDIPAPLTAALKALDRWADTIAMKDGSEHGPYEEHAARVLADVTAFVSRTSERAAARAKAGRVLSQANRTRLIDIGEQLKAAVGDLEDLADTDPNVDEKAALSVLAEFIEQEAAIDAVLSSH